MRPTGSKQMSLDKVRDLRQAYRNGFTVGEISKEFEINYQTVYAVVNRKSFKYV